MTIVAGFRCTDGIVLCADRQITRDTTAKYYADKLFPIKKENYVLVLGASGYEDLMRECFDKFSTRLPATDVTPEQVREMAGEILSGMGRFFQNGLSLELLIAVSASGSEPELFQFSGLGIYRVSEYAFLGVGDSSLVRYLSERLYHAELTIKKAYYVGAYIIKQAKAYIPGCGGLTDMIFIKPNAQHEIMDEEDLEIQEVSFYLWKDRKMFLDVFIDPLSSLKPNAP